MTKSKMTDDQVDEYVGALRRYDVDILISHPSMAYEEISEGLGREPHFAHSVGEKRVLLNGKVLPGTWPDTRWRCVSGYETTEQHFADEVEEVVDSLLPHKAFLDRLMATGGEAEVIVKFLGDGYFGDTLSWDTLANLAYLGLEFGIEAFIVPQNDGWRSED